MKYDPFMDFPIGSPEHRQFMVSTRSTQKIYPEIQTIINSPVGVIKPIIGSRGSGKSSWLLNMLYNLVNRKTVFSIYVNTFRSISTIKEVGRTVFMEKYVLNDIMSEILAKVRTVAPSLFLKEKWIENVAKNVITIPTPETMPNISADNLFDILRALKGEGYNAFVIAIDELDKLTEEGDPDFEKLVNMTCDFFGTQQGLFQKLSSEYRASLYISCDEKLVDPLERRDLTYLSNSILIERLDSNEVKRMIGARLSPQVEIFPFSQECLETLVSYFQGNARKIIFACGALMREASIRGLKDINQTLAKQLFQRVAVENFTKDFQDLAKLEESSIGAKMLWRLCSKIPTVEDRKQTLLFITCIYKGKEAKKPPESILKMLKDHEYLAPYKLPKEKQEINSRLISFFDHWIKKGHLIEDFIDWYSTSMQRPEETASIDNLVKSLLKAISDENIRQMINDSYDIYTYALEYYNQRDVIVIKSWSMLEKIIKAYCLETGFRDYALSLSEEQEDKHASIEYRDRISLLRLFTLALNKKKTRLLQLGTIKSIKETRNMVEHDGYMPTEDEAKMVKNNAKMAFEEVIKKWKIGPKVFMPQRLRFQHKTSL